MTHCSGGGLITALLVTVFAPSAAAQSDTQLWGEFTVDWIKSHALTLGLDVEPKALVSKHADEPGWAMVDVTPRAEYTRGKWFLESAFKLADVRAAIVCPLAIRIGVMHEKREAPSRTGTRVFEHLEIAVRIAEGRDRPSPNHLCDPDRLAGSIVDELDVGELDERRLAARRLVFELAPAANDLTDFTKSTIAVLVGPSFHDGSGSFPAAASDCRAATDACVHVDTPMTTTK